jgi:hypothetical protein
MLGGTMEFGEIIFVGKHSLDPVNERFSNLNLCGNPCARNI